VAYYSLLHSLIRSDLPTFYDPPVKVD
jgi:hypothetical protein